MSTDNSAVRLVGVSFRTGRANRLIDIDVTVQTGSVWGLVGPNGAGKTSLLRILAGLLTPTSGHGHVLDDDIRRRTRAGSCKLGYLPQTASTPPDLTVMEFLRFRASLYNLPDAGAAIHDAMALTGVSALSGRRLATLSGGWVRRIEMAAALIHKPSLLLLDEPTAGLDQDARTAIWRVIGLETRRGGTVVVNTHDLTEAAACDQLALLVDGRIRASGQPVDLLAQAGATNLAAAWPILVHGRRETGQ
jgi:ABC-2 type transport system ATP-binding protein